MKLAWRALALVALLTTLLAVPHLGCSELLSSPEEPTATLDEVSVHDLPPEAHTTLDLIDSDGPFPYDKDGSVFHNYEGLLPQKADGYYREYTVETPGASNRGARRIVTGGDGVRYYTDDHYESFRLIME
jgi:ribonuclease T1